MRKPLATGCIQNDDDISWKTFNYLLEKESLDDEIGHLYTLSILSLTSLMLTQNKKCTMKFIHQ